MLIRSAPSADDVELGGDDAWRPEYRGARNESGSGRSRRNICKFDIHWDENLPDIREAVESATSADAVTVIRCDRMRVFDVGLVRGRDCEGKAITQIAVWRIRRKPEQQRAE